MNKKKTIFVVTAILYILLGASSLISGIISIALGFDAMSNSGGRYSPSYKYGGDAYTGMQNAAADAANNISDMEQSVCEAIGYVSLAIGFGLNVAGGGFIIKGIRCFADTLDGAGGIPFAPLSADSTANHSRSDQTTEEAEETEETAEAEEDLSEYDVRFYREGGANNLVHIKIDDMNSKNLASDDEFTITLSRGNHTVLLYNGIKESKIRFDLKSNTQIEVNTLMGKPYIKSFTGSKVYKM